MNSMIFFLYLADITGSLVNTGALFAGIGALVGAVGTFMCMVVFGPNEFHGNDNDERVATRLRLTGTFKSLFLGSTIIVVILCLVPSKTFLYTLVGVRSAEIVVTSDLGQKSLKAIEHKVDQYINEHDLLGEAE
jgi:hypothetical protein